MAHAKTAPKKTDPKKPALEATNPHSGHYFGMYVARYHTQSLMGTSMVAEHELFSACGTDKEDAAKNASKYATLKFNDIRIFEIVEKGV